MIEDYGELLQNILFFKFHSFYKNIKQQNCFNINNNNCFFTVKKNL